MSGHPKPSKGRARAGKLAFVLGGGGARGALQVGALRALYEAGYRPDVLVGTSIGAANAAFVAIHGFTPDALEGLEGVWRDAARRELLPAASFLRLTARLLLGRPRQAQDRIRARIRAFLVAHGIDPALTFGELKVPLVLVATDLSRFEPVLYGRDPDAPVLEGLLASMAIPPWVAPLRVGDRLLMDGGLLSNLPIEPALSQGATRVIALSLADPRGADGASPDAGGVGVGPLLTRMLVAVEYRQMYLEARLAKERGVPLFVLNLRAKEPVPIWDFRRAAALIEEGYEQARRQIARWPDALAFTFTPGPESARGQAKAP